MALEVVAALALALLVLWLVFEPMLRPEKPDLTLLEPEAAEETRRGVALLALKEIEFDRETGKLSQRDYELLKTRYGAEALAALEAEAVATPLLRSGGGAEALIALRARTLRAAQGAGEPPPASCRSCGPRPEPGAIYCSRCGLPLNAASYCASCGAALPDDSRFCAGCGRKVAA